MMVMRQLLTRFGHLPSTRNKPPRSRLRQAVTSKKKNHALVSDTPEKDKGDISVVRK